MTKHEIERLYRTKQYSINQISKRLGIQIHDDFVDQRTHEALLQATVKGAE